MRSSNTAAHVVRRDAVATPMNGTIIDLLIALLALLVTALVLVVALFILRRRRKARHAFVESLPVYSEKRASSSSTQSQHRRNTIRPTQFVNVYNEKETLMEKSEPPSPTDSLPEIRVTFPEEVDEAGKRQSGKVVVVRVGDTSVGFEPVSQTPPPYQQTEGERFQSIDLERVGGLVEQPRTGPSWD